MQNVLTLPEFKKNDNCILKYQKILRRTIYTEIYVFPKNFLLLNEHIVNFSTELCKCLPALNLSSYSSVKHCLHTTNYTVFVHNIQYCIIGVFHIFSKIIFYIDLMGKIIDLCVEILRTSLNYTMACVKIFPRSS